MGSNWKTITGCGICGLALCVHLQHEAHEEADYIKRPFAQKPMLEPVLSARQSHGEEPEQPSGPLRSPQGIEATSSTVSSTVAPMSLGSIGMGNVSPNGLVWHPKPSAWGGTSDQSTGASLPAICSFTIVPIHYGMGNGLPNGLAWNPNSSGMIWAGTTDQSGGSNLSAGSGFTIVSLPYGKRWSS